MGACHDVRQVFRYVFRPLGAERKGGGFSIHLYNDGNLYFRVYDLLGFVIHEEIFSVSLDVITEFDRLCMDNQCWLVHKMPCLVGRATKQSACIIEIGDYAPIYAINLKELISVSASDPVGFFAARVWTLFENASSLLLWCGLYLFVDHFASVRLKPLLPYDNTCIYEID